MRNSRSVLLLAIAGALVLFSGSGVKAAALSDPGTTSLSVFDGALSLNAPGSLSSLDENGDLAVLTFDAGTLSIARLSEGEALPAPLSASASDAVLCQLYLPAGHDTFVVTASSEDPASLPALMAVIGSLNLPAPEPEEEAAPESEEAAPAAAADDAKEAPSSSELLKTPGTVNASYYITATKLNVRSEPSTDGELLGTFTYGDFISVDAITAGEGSTSLWAEITYEGKKAYVSADYLSAKKPDPLPVSESTGSSSASSDETSSSYYAESSYEESYSSYDGGGYSYTEPAYTPGGTTQGQGISGLEELAAREEDGGELLPEVPDEPYYPEGGEEPQEIIVDAEAAEEG